MGACWPWYIHWQSFGHPTDTLLSGGWVGIKNKATGENARLTSWKSKEDPAPGPFSYEVDSNQSQLLSLWNGTEMYYNTGVWNGEFFSGIPEIGSRDKATCSFVDNKTAKYFTYNTYDPMTFGRCVMDVSGHIRQFYYSKESSQWNLCWSNPRYQCDVYAVCGTFGSCNDRNNPFFCTCLPGFIPKVQKDWDLGSSSDGCTRKTPLQVALNSTLDVEKDRFWALPFMKLPDQSEFLSVASAEGCRLACLNKQSCTAYAFESGCRIWSGDLVNLQQLSEDWLFLRQRGMPVPGLFFFVRGLSEEDASARTLFLRLAASEVPISKSRKGIIAGIIVGSVIGLAFAVGIVLFLIQRCQTQRKKALMAAVARGSLVAFSYRNLQSVTKNFSQKLGGGGFGSVFKGAFPHLTMVAVKRLEGLRQGEKQFRTEVSTIGTIQHVNLIRLRGFCSEGDKKLLVCDYMPNGSLNSHLFGTATYLDWSRRYRIAIETARGLAYLHEKCRDFIIHCDIKPENILLDDAFSVKIADFGLAKLFGREFSHVLTTLRGTLGYLAPEWISGLSITPKADVYSYGMMLFEIISGRRSREESLKKDKQRSSPLGR